MMYQVVEVTQRRFNDGTFDQKKMVLCSFKDRKECEKYIKDLYFSMLGLGYEKPSLTANVYHKTYKIENPYALKTLTLDETIKYVVTEAWTPDEQ